jgi:hypothetical protein
MIHNMFESKLLMLETMARTQLPGGKGGGLSDTVPHHRSYGDKKVACLLRGQGLIANYHSQRHRARRRHLSSCLGGTIGTAATIRHINYPKFSRELLEATLSLALKPFFEGTGRSTARRFEAWQAQAYAKHNVAGWRGEGRQTRRPLGEWETPGLSASIMHIIDYPT